MSACLVLAVENQDKIYDDFYEIRSEYQRLIPNIWQTLEFEIPYSEKYYNCIKVEIILEKDSYFKDGFDGIALYFDDLTITEIANYCVGYSKDNWLHICNDYHYPMLENFTVCYGEVYGGLLENKEDSKERLLELEEQTSVNARSRKSVEDMFGRYYRFYSGLHGDMENIKKGERN